jgi:hypothetical protein
MIAIDGLIASTVVFSRKPAFLLRSYGSSETQNLKNAVAHTQGLTSLAGASAQ